MDKLRVRVYNVRFGDAILVSIPDKTGRKTVTRHMLIDVGNVLSGTGGDDLVFEPVIRDIHKVLHGRPLDLYVMTHEHMDHVQGLFYAAKTLDLPLTAKYAWLTASAAEDYYDRHPDAKKRRLEALAAYDQIERFLQASPESESPVLRALRLNNNPRSTADCVAYLRKLTATPTYVYRGCDLAGKHPFREAQIDIWAPEEDTTDYYGSFHPMALGLTAGNDRQANSTLTMPRPPSGVDAGSFYNLVEARRQGYADNLLSIDSAANNTSIVFCLEWRNWRLLFSGDAEQRSWKTIWKMLRRETPLKPIHLIKVSHHGSHNGMPIAGMLDELMPKRPPDDRQRYAIISTCLDTYNNVPDEAILTELGKRCDVRSVLDIPEGKFYFDIEFEG